jgi:hypothetical protein
LFVPFPIYVFIGAPGLGRLIGSAVLRRREFLADADAVLLTRNPGGLAGALAKIAAAQSGTFEMNPALHHLCVVSPVKGRISWWQRGIATHPPIEERIARLEELGADFDAATPLGRTEAAARIPTTQSAVYYEEATGRPDQYWVARPPEERGVPIAKIVIFVLAFLVASFLATMAFYFWCSHQREESLPNKAMLLPMFSVIRRARHSSEFLDRLVMKRSTIPKHLLAG